MQAPLSLFYSYSHRDERLRDELEVHLSALRRSGLVESWHDRRIGAGEDWSQAIDARLRTADLVLCLLSADFLASNYCYERELGLALERHQRGEARVIPIVLRPCDWMRTPLGTLQALPRDAKPVTQWSNRDQAWLDVVGGLRRVAEALRPPAPGR